ncbi:MAG: ecdysteroid 22-kinase family protein [Novosphingobium sp.]|nr:ecdysteroid 22-kinase family protein [Novosphingobium sp.]
MIKVPERIEDITAAWMTDALQEKFPGVTIRKAEIVDVVHGACTKIRIGLEGDHPGLPPRMLMKIGFEQHSPKMRGMHLNEYNAYTKLMPVAGISHPVCHAAVLDDEGKSLVVLEDLCLRDVTFLALQKPIGFDLAAAFLEGLAKLHARLWDSPGLQTDFAWVPGTSEAEMEHYFTLLLTPDLFEGFATSPRGAAMPKMVLDPPRVRAGLAAMRKAHEGMATVVNHGDMHLGNLYTNADGSPGFLDSQPRRGAWSIDVSYFITAGLDLVDRRRWQGALLQHYLAALAARGVTPPTFDEAFAAFRRDVIWGHLIWMLNASHFQTEANNTAAATRFAMAMVDLDTFGALGV